MKDKTKFLISIITKIIQTILLISSVVCIYKGISFFYLLFVLGILPNVYTIILELYRYFKKKSVGGGK